MTHFSLELRGKSRNVLTHVPDKMKVLFDYELNHIIRKNVSEAGKRLFTGHARKDSCSEECESPVQNLTVTSTDRKCV